MDQMKMHKMMYFSQREALMIANNPLFDGTFEAWKYGPVLCEVRSEYFKTQKFADYYGDLSEDEKRIVNSAFERYASESAWRLSSLSHEEFSWRQARGGAAYNDPSTNPMSLSAIRVDAKRELLRRKGVLNV